ncbi:MAG: 50S ribosomal protein L24 [gamma proteobacterium endosymbiont of Trioza apicalis]
MSKKICFNDNIIVLTGKNKGKIGKVVKILPNFRIMINFNNYHKSICDLNQFNIKKKEFLINISNVAIFNFLTKKSDRVGFKYENGKKIRFLKSNNKIIY